MPGVEQHISVKIKALVDGLNSVKELNSAITSLKSSGGKKFDIGTKGTHGELTGLLGGVRKVASAARNELTDGMTAGAGALGRVLSVAGPVGIALAGVSAISLGLGTAFSAVVSRAVEFGSRLNDISLETGLTVETLSGLDSQLQESGTNLEAISNAVLFMHKNLGEAAGGSKELKAAFASMGIHDLDTALADTDGTLRKVIKSLGEMTDEGKRDAIGSKVLGRAYKELRVFISDTGGDIEEVMRKAEAAGLVMSGEVAANLDALGDAWDRLAHKAQVAGAKMAGGLLAKELERSLDDIGLALVGNSNLWESWGTGIAFMVGRVRGSLEGLAKWMKGNTWSPRELGRQIEEGSDAGGRQVVNDYHLSPFRRTQAANEAMLARVNRSGDGGGGGGGGKGGGRSKKNDIADRLVRAQGQEEASSLDLLHSKLEAGFNQFKDYLDREQSLLDQDLADKLISIKDYYAEKERLQLENIDNEIARQDAALERENDKLTAANKEAFRKFNKGDITEEERRLELNAALNKYDEAETKILERIATLESDRLSVAIKITAERKKELAAFQQMLDEVNEQLAIETGDDLGALEAAKQRIDAAHKDRLAQIELEKGAGSTEYKQAMQLVEVLKQKAEYQLLFNQLKQQQAALDFAEEQIRNAVARGDTKDKAGREQLIAAQLKHKAAIEETIKRMKELGDESGIAEMILDAERAAESMKDLGRVIDEEAVRINQSLKDAAKDTLFDILRDPGNAMSAITRLINHILDELARLAADSIMEQLFGEDGILSGIFGGKSGGGIGGIFAGIFGGKKSSGGSSTGGVTVNGGTPPIFGNFLSTLKGFQSGAVGGLRDVNQSTLGVRGDVFAGFQSSNSRIQEIISFLPNLLPAPPMAWWKQALLAGVGIVGSILTKKYGTPQEKADGGLITGAGTETSDSIPAWLSNNEFVMRAAAVRKIGPRVLEYMNRVGSLPMERFAFGGPVGFDMPDVESSSLFTAIKGGRGDIHVHQTMPIYAKDAQSIRENAQQIRRDLARAAEQGVKRSVASRKE